MPIQHFQQFDQSQRRLGFTVFIARKGIHPTAKDFSGFASPYPDRIAPKPSHEKELSERTLTKLYNARPAWLTAAHAALDQAVATAYGWTDYTPEMADEVILQRLLALNLERSVERSVARSA